MVGLLSSLVEPVAKVILKAWLGEAAADIGGGLVKYARDVLQDPKRAGDAVQQARTIATALVSDIESWMAREGMDEAVLEPAKIELWTTLEKHVNTGLLIGGHLNPTEIERVLNATRPVDSFFKKGEPEREAYI